MLATQNAFLVGILLIMTETVVLSAFRPWEEWINVVLGAWLVISPWVLNVSPAATVTANFVIVGLLVFGPAFSTCTVAPRTRPDFGDGNARHREDALPKQREKMEETR